MEEIWARFWARFMELYMIPLSDVPVGAAIIVALLLIGIAVLWIRSD
jgi:hypothetical protein